MRSDTGHRGSPTAFTRLLSAGAMLRPYITETHSFDTIRRWATSLRVFRFSRAAGGHAGDGDQFLAALAYDGEADFRALLLALGLPATEIPPGTPDPVPGQAYGAEWKQFPNRIPGLPHIEQPSHSRISGVACHVWSLRDRLQISVIGDPPSSYMVDEEAFERARRIDSHLISLADRVIDPPRQSDLCVCPQHYPDLWAPPPA